MYIDSPALGTRNKIKGLAAYARLTPLFSGIHAICQKIFSYFMWMIESRLCLNAQIRKLGTVLGTIRQNAIQGEQYHFSLSFKRLISGLAF